MRNIMKYCISVWVGKRTETIVYTEYIEAHFFIDAPVSNSGRLGKKKRSRFSSDLFLFGVLYNVRGSREISHG